MSAVLTIALLLSGLLVLTSWAPADGGTPVEPQNPLPEVSDSEEGTIESTPTVPRPHGGWTREGVRAWVEKMGVPTAQLLTSPRERAFFEMGEGVGGGIITPHDVNEVAVHQSDLAHMLGFNGTGVTVAVVDTGVDFAHPDLYNRTARVLNPLSDYYLHPMAHDASSLNDYLRFGEPGPESWFVNTSFSAPVIQVANGTRWVDWSNATTTLSWNVTGVAGLTVGEEVRIGFHPDEKLELLLGMRAGLILFQDAGAGGPFDSVMVDLDGDFDMGDEKRAYFNAAFGPSFDPEAELIFQDLTGDGIQDVSGGMVYFISDGVREIPYASRQIKTLNFTWQTFTNNNSFDIWEGLDPAANLVPGDGNLTLIFGDLNEPDTFGSHGTWIASAIAGQGRTGGFGGGPVLTGQAPGAKILGAGNNLAGADPLGFGIFTALIFAAEGYDGVPGTGDEAQIASNSWGGPGWGGWDWSSRFVDYVSTVLADEAILYVFAAGNNGPGLGGRADPQGGASLLIAGGMENYFYRLDPWFAFGTLDGGPNPSFGGTAEFSSRGPSALGRHYIDALASGASGYGADPLNDNPFVEDSGLTLDGSSSWILWSGTSLSAPNLAGVAALVYDAYASAHPGFPMASTAKRIIKNAADDAGQDPFLTGAGLANALRGVLIASEADGLTTSIDEWNPGDYRGTVYDAYPNLLPAGGGDVMTVTLTNHRPAMPLDVTVADAVLANTGNVSFSFTRAPFSGADEYLFNAAGFMAMDGTVLVPGSPTLWATADTIRVSVYISRQDMITYTPMFRFRIYDWTDTNGNGASEGISEGNLMTQDMPTWLDLHGPNGYMFVHDPAARSHDGLYLRNDVFREATDPVDVHVVVDYFERMDAPWLTASVPMVTIPAASSTTVDLMVSVPAEAKPGLYEAMYLFTLPNGDVTTLPVVVNVAAGSIPFTFGDPSVGDDGHYQQGQAYGLWWGDLDIIEDASGDWRYYFLDLVEAVNATILVGWDEPLSHYALHVLTNEPDWFSDNAMARYGPNTLATVAFTDIDIPTGNGASVVAPLNPGLSIIAVQSVFVAGVGGVAETLRGEVAVIGVSPSSLTGVGVPVEDEGSFTVTSPDLAFSGLQSSIESGSVLMFLDQPVDPFPHAGQSVFEIYLFEAPNRLRMDIAPTVTRVTYELFFHSGARDVDFGVFSDPDCDMVYTVADIEDFVGTLDNPEILAINNPIAGCHWVHVAGFSVAPGSLYDLTVTFVAAPVVSVTSLPADLVPAIPADVTIAWALPHTSQPVAGTVFIGSTQFPRAIPLPFALVADLPPMLSGRTPIPGSLSANNAPSIGLTYQDTPDAFETAVDPDSVVLRLDGADMSSLALATASSVFLGLAVLPFTLQDGLHFASVEVRDLSGSVNRTTWSFTVDTTAPSLNIAEPTVPITNNPMVTVSGMTEPGATVTVDGTAVTVDPAGAFSTVLTLSDGDHALPVVATDVVGNAASRTVNVTVDTVAPAISLSSPSDGETVTNATVTVVGQTEPGAAVSVNGIALKPAADGSFSVSLALSVGDNTITATATDLAGNSESMSVSVTFTDQGPGSLGDLANLQGQVTLLLALAVVGFALAGVLFLLYWKQRREP